MPSLLATITIARTISKELARKRAYLKTPFEHLEANKGRGLSARRTL
jgi:hypothetical protein